jgi:hypothetical protein
MQRFEEWVRFVFDHEVVERRGESWYWKADDELERWASDAALNVGRMTELLLRPASLAPFSREQVAQGLWFLLGPSPADLDRDLYDPAVELGINRQSSGLSQQVCKRHQAATL